MTIQEAKKQLDIIIDKSRVHMYKPIQIAEILYHHRINPLFSLGELEHYRRSSKSWRDEVSRRLVGSVCTSSSKFQDNIFEDNAVNPKNIMKLGMENEIHGQEGIVEKYIYQKLIQKLSPLKKLKSEIENSDASTFKLSRFIGMFQREPGLRRSIDKVYEIVVYALFDTLVFHLNANVSLSIPPEKIEMLREFEDFTKIVLGVDAETPTLSYPAKLYRVGVANAADRGLDMWANFGPAIQIKHISLTINVAEEIVNQVMADKIVIVCQDAESSTINNVLRQIGLGDRIQGIITQSDLERWYLLCLNETHASTMGSSILESLLREFEFEFPSTTSEIDDFKHERGYDELELEGIWE